jgi:SOS response regulatory protein OraA/RecX
MAGSRLTLDRDEVMALAAHDLARRARSAAELRARLARVAPDDVAAGVVDDLEQLGYVDDAALARALVERRLASGWGGARVEADLERLGIRGEAASAALELAAEQEPAAAAALLVRERPAGVRRAWALLARRGFSADAAEAAVERLASAE